MWHRQKCLLLVELILGGPAHSQSVYWQSFRCCYLIRSILIFVYSCFDLPSACCPRGLPRKILHLLFLPFELLYLLPNNTMRSYFLNVGIMSYIMQFVITFSLQSLGFSLKAVHVGLVARVALGHVLPQYSGFLLLIFMPQWFIILIFRLQSIRPIRGSLSHQ
jgi:hypothetical protein